MKSDYRYQYNTPDMNPIDQFATDYPDIAGPVKQMVEAQTSALHTRIFEETMDLAYPTWRDLRDSPEFGKWMQANPDMQQKAQEPGIRAALVVLEAFDSSKGRKPSPRSAAFQQTLDGYAATDSPSSFTGKPGQQSQVPSLDDALDGFAAE